MEGLREVPANWLSSEGILKGTDIVCEESALSITISNGSDITVSAKTLLKLRKKIITIEINLVMYNDCLGQ